MSDYVWRNDLIERHSLTLVGPEGWLAHVLRNDDGSWYGFEAGEDGTLEILIDHQRDLHVVMGCVYALVACCEWTTGGDCDQDRQPFSDYCPAHTATAQLIATCTLRDAA